MSLPPSAFGRVVRVPRAGLSLRLHTRSVVVGLVLTLVAAVLLVLSVGTGDFAIPPGDVIRTLLGGGDAADAFVIETLRLPRVLTGLLVGAALGASGAIFQSLTRNPLGSPDVMGFLQGASAVAVLEIIVLGGGTFAIAAGSIVGGVGTALLVYVLAFRGGGVQGYRLVLIGVGLGAMLVSITEYLISRGTLAQAQNATFWITGSLNGRGWEHVRPVALALAVLLPAVAMLSRRLQLLELGDDAARALGLGVERARAQLMLAGVLLAAVATASSGPIVFVALAAPQLARRLTRVTGPGVGCAALMGAVLLSLSDFLAQRVFASQTLPVGVVTGVLGGVYLVVLLIVESRRGSA